MAGRSPESSGRAPDRELDLDVPGLEAAGESPWTFETRFQDGSWRAVRSEAEDASAFLEHLDLLYRYTILLAERQLIEHVRNDPHQTSL